MRGRESRIIRRTFLGTWLAAGVSAMGEAGRSADAARSWERLSGETGNPTLEELAKWHRISLGASR